MRDTGLRLWLYAVIAVDGVELRRLRAVLDAAAEDFRRILDAASRGSA